MYRLERSHAKGDFKGAHCWMTPLWLGLPTAMVWSAQKESHHALPWEASRMWSALPISYWGYSESSNLAFLLVSAQSWHLCEHLLRGNLTWIHHILLIGFEGVIP